MPRKRKTLPADKMPDAKEIAQAYAGIFSQGAGEIILADLHAQFSKSTIVVTPTGVDPYGTVVNEGSRRVLIYIEAKMQEGEEYGRSTTGGAAKRQSAADDTGPGNNVFDA